MVKKKVLANLKLVFFSQYSRVRWSMLCLPSSWLFNLYKVSVVLET